jgi:hypothetical protein
MTTSPLRYQQSTIHCNTKRYTFTIKKTRSGKSYLEISEVREGTNTLPACEKIYIFPEYVAKFGVVVNKMLSDLEASERGGRANL